MAASGRDGAGGSCGGRVAAAIAVAVLAAGAWRPAAAAPPLVRAKGQQPPFSQIDAMSFLQKYGYLHGAEDATKASMHSADGVQEALKAYQAFSGLPVTGELDEATRRLMRTPRCGVKDVEDASSDHTRRRRYTLQGSRWDTTSLTYRVTKYPSRPREALVDEAVRQALGVWQRHSGLRFAAAGGAGAADIDVRFERGHHSDCDPFDGRGGTLGHAYYPRFGGAAHFDAEELWTVDEFRGTNLFQVAAHEFGHSLGLKHSAEPDALMAPVYRYYDPYFELHADDVAGIQALYGPPPQETNDVLQQAEDDQQADDDFPFWPAPAPSGLCADASIDTIFTSAEGHLYVFKGDEYYKLAARDGDLALEDGYPKAIGEGWPGLPGHVDAAFSHPNGKSYFFKGALYWRFEGRRVDDGFPRRIAEGFTGVPDDVDAAVFWPNGKLYFFKGAEFWTYDPRRSPPVHWTEPRPVALWSGVPDGLDAALVHEGFTYFFKGPRYYRFDDVASAVDTGSPPFPRPTGRWWFGCGRPEESKHRTDE